MGSVRIRKETGLLYLDYRWQGKRCREQTKLTDTKTNRHKCEALLGRVELAIKNGTFNRTDFFGTREQNAQSPRSSEKVPSTTPLFEAFYYEWFSEQVVTWREATKENIEWASARYLLPSFGKIPVDKITRPDVLKYRADLATRTDNPRKKPISASSINDIVGILKSIMDEAAARYNFVSPTENIKRLKEQKHDINPFSLSEVQSIIASVREDYQSYMTVRFFTGMRSGEINGLKWRYVDFEANEILIRETWSKGRLEYTKTDSSQRNIRMSKPVRDALLKQQAGTGQFAFVFCNKRGQPIDVNNFTSRIWYPLLDLLNIQRRRPYETRHTAATLWLASGESPEWIARQLGHSTTEMLFRVYSRYVPNLTRNDGDAMERLLDERLGGLSDG